MRRKTPAALPPITRYTKQELDEAALADVRVDLKMTEERLASGNFTFGWTRELCEREIARHKAFLVRYADGGAHDAVIRGEMV